VRPFDETLEKLNQASEKNYPNPYPQLEWPETLDREQWFASPEFLSLYGTPAYEALPEARRKLLSFYEAVNFFCLNILGEKQLVEGATRRLYVECHRQVWSYLHHFIDEENKHLEYFGRFCVRYAGRVYFTQESQPIRRAYERGEEDFIFFARTLISEDIIVAYNARMAGDERLHPLARTIHYLHQRDEARHRLFGRQYVEELFRRHSPGWSARTLEAMRGWTASTFLKTWELYYNPEMYGDAGFPDAGEVSRAAWGAPCAAAHRNRVSADCLKFFKGLGVLDGEFSL
jgi:hypothetical protein